MPTENTDVKALKARKNKVLDAQVAILNGAQAARRQLSDAEIRSFDNMSRELDAINIKLGPAKAAPLKTFSALAGRDPALIIVAQGRMEIATPRETPAFGDFSTGRTYKNCSAEYAEAFWNAMAKKTFSNTAALSEGGTAADGSYLVPQETSTVIPALAMEEVSARKLSRCIVTQMDLKLPYQSSRSVATAKAESTDGGQNAFGVSVPQFETTTLSAFMHGQQVSVSWELQQDVPALSSFLVDEFNRSVTTYEESVFVGSAGTGSGVPLSYVNGATAFETAALSSGSILDLIASVRKDYFAGSSFLFNRSEFHRLYKSQISADMFQTWVTYDANGQAKLLGFPVFFSSELASYVASPATNGQVLFGNFRAGFTLGDRGDNGIHVKMLDQVAAQSGQTVYLCWRRSDQRCVLQEAVSLLTTNG